MLPAAREPLQTRVPTFEGRHRVWSVPVPEGTGHACLAYYLVDAPGVHAIWRCWAVSLVHLRPIAGVGNAHLHYAGATHSILSLALDPDIAPDPNDVSTHRRLEPIDFEVQFTVSDDVAATTVMTTLMSMVAKGQLHPDTDFRAAWLTHARHLSKP